MRIEGMRVGVLVVATSSVHLTRVDISASEWGATGPPDEPMPSQDHAALVVVDCYWIYISGCNLVGAEPPDYAASDGKNTSQRPSVIFRGQDSPSHSPTKALGVVNQIYLVTITDTVFNFGGVQYQQLSPHCSPPAAGFFSFKNIVQESSQTPLLDIVGLSNSNRTTPAEFAQITVDGYMNADAGPGSHLLTSGLIKFNLR